MTTGIEPAVVVADDNEAALLARFLAGREVACPQCGYNLRDLVGGRCPECGEALVLRVNLVEPRQAAVITGLVALSSGLGLNGLLLMFGLIMELRRPINEWSFFVVNIVGAIAEGLALFLWLRHWKAVRRLTRRAQWGWVAGCFALTLLDLILFTIVVR